MNEQRIIWLNALIKKGKAKQLNYYPNVVITEDKEFYDINTGEQLKPTKNKLILKKRAGELHTINVNNCYNFHFRTDKTVKIDKERLYKVFNSSGKASDIDMRTYKMTLQCELGTIVKPIDNEEIRYLEAKHVKALLSSKREQPSEDIMNEIFKQQKYKYLQVSDHGRITYGTVFEKRETGLNDRSPTAPYKYHFLKLTDSYIYPTYVHRLVAIIYKYDDFMSLVEQGIPLHHIVVNHKDGNKHNNHIDNLEWVTQEENVAHARMMKQLRIGSYARR